MDIQFVLDVYACATVHCLLTSQLVMRPEREALFQVSTINHRPLS